MSLVKAELRRLSKRRVTLWMLVIVVLLLGAIAAGIAATNQQVGPGAVAAAEEDARRDYEEQRRWFEQSVEDEIAACERAQQAGSEEAEGWPADCEEIRLWGPQPEHFDPQWYMPPTFHFRGQFPGLIMAFAGIMGMFAFIVGASFVGAEWRSGGMMNLLLWRPRRLQVLGAKLGTLLLGLLGLGVALGAAWTAVMWLVASFRGITDTVTAGVWQSFALTGVRGLVLVLAAGAIGFGLASLGRHTAMALGAAVAAVVALIGTLITVETAGVRYAEAWLWITYVRAWMDKAVVLYDWRSCDFSFGECQPATLEITWQMGGVGIGAVVILLVGAAMWQMRSRDVT